MRIQQTPTPTEWMWPRDVADAFGVSTDTITRWADAGQIPVYRLPSGRRRYRRDDIERLLRDAS